MGVVAEGELITNRVTTAEGEFLFVDADGGQKEPSSFEVAVEDGELNIEFFDDGGHDTNWVVNHLTLEFVR